MHLRAGVVELVLWLVGMQSVVGIAPSAEAA